MQRLVKAPVAFLVPQVVQTLLLREGSSDVARDASIILDTPSSSIPTVEGSCNIARDARIIVATPSSSNPNVEGSSDIARDASVTCTLAVKVKIVLLLKPLSVKTRIICMSLIHLL